MTPGDYDGAGRKRDLCGRNLTSGGERVSLIEVVDQRAQTRRGIDRKVGPLWNCDVSLVNKDHRDVQALCLPGNGSGFLRKHSMADENGEVAITLQKENRIQRLAGRGHGVSGIGQHVIPSNEQRRGPTDRKEFSSGLGKRRNHYLAANHVPSHGLYGDVSRLMRAGGGALYLSAAERSL